MKRLLGSFGLTLVCLLSCTEQSEVKRNLSITVLGFFVVDKVSLYNHVVMLLLLAGTAGTSSRYATSPFTLSHSFPLTVFTLIHYLWTCLASRLVLLPPATDCSQIKAVNPRAVSSIYTVQPPGAKSPFKVLKNTRSVMCNALKYVFVVDRAVHWVVTPLRPSSQGLLDWEL